MDKKLCTQFSDRRIYHLCNKSIAHYRIFRSDQCMQRFALAVNYYNNIKVAVSLSKALRTELVLPNIMKNDKQRVISLLAYCFMPDHYHLLVKVLTEYSLSKYMNNVESSYSHYFNKLTNRKGPLWQSRFRLRIINDNETLLHVHRYIHLNPVTANIVEKPEHWAWSSYNYYVSGKGLMEHAEISFKSQIKYKKFVEDQIDYQKTLKHIKLCLLE